MVISGVGQNFYRNNVETTKMRTVRKICIGENGKHK